MVSSQSLRSAKVSKSLRHLQQLCLQLGHLRGVSCAHPTEAEVGQGLGHVLVLLVQLLGCRRHLLQDLQDDLRAQAHAGQLLNHLMV